MAMLLMDRDTKLPKLTSAPSSSSSRFQTNSIDTPNTADTLRTLAAGADVYVHVDESTALVRAVLSHLPNAVAVTYDKPNVAKDSNNATDGAMVRSVVQWWRLRAIWSMVQWLEMRCKHEHRAVVRVRADLRISMPAAAPSLSALFLRPLTSHDASKTVIMASDYAFAANRPTMKRIATFYDRIEAGEYYDVPLSCHAVDYALLVESDWESHGPCLLKYNWMSFPRVVFDALAVKSCRAVGQRMSLLRDALRETLPNTTSTRVQQKRHHECYSCFPGQLQGFHGFESERTFLMYLLSNGIRIRRWPTRTKLGTLNDGCCCANSRASSLPHLSRGVQMVD